MNILEIGIKKGEEIGEERGKEIGKEIGERIGRETKLVEQISRKLKKGKAAAQIAEELEEDENLVKQICLAAEGLGPDYNATEVYCSWKSEKKETPV